MSCSFCHGTNRKKRQMTENEFSHIIQSLAGITQYIYLHVLGEPLTHSRLCDFIKIAAEKGFKVAITTNGTLLKDKCDELLASGIFKVNISLHSFEGNEPKKHENYVNVCLDFAEKASKSGILTVLRLWNGGSQSTEIHAKNERTLALIRDKFLYFESESARGLRIRDKLHLEYADSFDWPDINGLDLGENVFCHGLGDHFGILADGSVIPCCLDAEGDITLGNIFTEDINQILTSERALAVKNGFQSKKACEPLCRRCGYARRFKI